MIINQFESKQVVIYLKTSVFEYETRHLFCCCSRNQRPRVAVVNAASRRDHETCVSQQVKAAQCLRSFCKHCAPSLACSWGQQHIDLHTQWCRYCVALAFGRTRGLNPNPRMDQGGNASAPIEDASRKKLVGKRALFYRTHNSIPRGSHYRTSLSIWVLVACTLSTNGH